MVLNVVDGCLFVPFNISKPLVEEGLSGGNISDDIDRVRTDEDSCFQKLMSICLLCNA